MAFALTDVRIARLDLAAYTIPTEQPESDGTLEWDSTTLIVVHAAGGDEVGLGYTYAHRAAAVYGQEKLAPVVVGRSAMEIEETWHAMWAAARNDGQAGLAAMALSAIDCALWDLKARLLQLPLVDLLGRVRSSIDLYASGGFTSCTEQQLAEQFTRQAGEGFTRFKMKIGRDAAADPKRVAAARRTIGDEAELFVDANGAYARRQALYMAQLLADESRVTWFEEPLPADDLAGLRWLCGAAPSTIEIAGGEYGYRLPDFARIVDAAAVDCLMADVTRCGGISGFLRIAHFCEARNVPLSAHTAPAQHVHICCACRAVRHVEWFFDHARIERMLFDGAPHPQGGRMMPQTDQPGMGLIFKAGDAERYRVL